MKEFYISKISKSDVKECFTDGTWNKDIMTSVVVMNPYGKLYQIFGAKGTYGYVTEGVVLYSSYSQRSIDCGRIVIENTLELQKNAAMYVFK